MCRLTILLVSLQAVGSFAQDGVRSDDSSTERDGTAPSLACLVEEDGSVTCGDELVYRPRFPSTETGSRLQEAIRRHVFTVEIADRAAGRTSTDDAAWLRCARAFGEARSFLVVAEPLIIRAAPHAPFHRVHALLAATLRPSDASWSERRSERRDPPYLFREARLVFHDDEGRDVSYRYREFDWEWSTILPSEEPPALSSPEVEPEEARPPSYEGSQWDLLNDSPLLAARTVEKRTRLEAYAGVGTEDAVEAGLRWLQHHQNEDGSWRPEAFDRECTSDVSCDGRGSESERVAVTSLALLAFLGDGQHSNHRTRYQSSVKRGLMWLLANQDVEGTHAGLISPGSLTIDLHAHALATLVLAEAFELSRQEQLRRPAQHALDRAFRSQGEHGGWSRSGRRDDPCDLPTTTWMILAMRTARDAGLKVDPERWARVVALYGARIDHERTEERRRTPLQRSSQEAAWWSENPGHRTAWSLIACAFLGRHPSTDSDRLRQAEWLAKASMDQVLRVSPIDLLHTAVVTEALFQMGGPFWNLWNPEVRRAVLSAQRREPSDHRFGSWDPQGPSGVVGGRVASTALAVLCLEVYYRHERSG